MYEDKTLVCKECGKEFIFSAGEQEFYASKGFVNEPQRCKACRDTVERCVSRRGRCTQLCAPLAEKKRECRSSRVRIVPSTAASALQR